MTADANLIELFKISSNLGEESIIWVAETPGKWTLGAAQYTFVKSKIV